MAAVQKFSAQEIFQQLRHIERTIQNPKNKDIDPSRRNLNYSFVEDRGMTSYDYFLQRKEELYYRKQADLKPMAGWVVTAPDDLATEDELDFFRCVHEFLCERYGGKENCIQSIVHNDELGKAHLHFYFIPTVPDKKHGGYKISAKLCLDRRELRNFHSDLQRYLDDYLKEKDMHWTVYSGITKKQGGNRTVKEYKKELQRERERNIEMDWWET